MHKPASTSWNLFNYSGDELFCCSQVRRFLEKRRNAKAQPPELLWIGQKGLTDSRRAELKQQVEEYITAHKVRDSSSFVNCRMLCMLIVCVLLCVVLTCVSWRVCGAPRGGAAAAPGRTSEGSAAEEGGAAGGGAAGTYTHPAGDTQRSHTYTQLHTSWRFYRDHFRKTVKDADIKTWICQQYYTSTFLYVCTIDVYV